MPAEDAGQRLQKALAHLGLGSRREVEDWIRAGRLTVNGQPASLGMRVTSQDQVKLDGRLVRQRVSLEAGDKIFVAHRSPGMEMRELTQQLPRSAGRRFIAISPMPAIDGGLELLTSGGALAERLQRGVRRLTGEFSVRVHGELPEVALEHIQAGQLDSGATVTVQKIEAGGGEGSNRWYTVKALGASGKDIRQLVEREGALVSRVLRTSLGPVLLDRALPRGRHRLLTEEEQQALLAAIAAEPEAG